MHQELTTPPAIFPEISLEQYKTTCKAPSRLSSNDIVELLILALLAVLGGTVFYELLFMNSPAMQIAQSLYAHL